MRTLLAMLVLLFCGPLALAQKEFGFDNHKASGQPYLTPQESVARFKVPEEFEVKLFAGEPMIVNPVAFTIDEKGRIWVVECFDYPKKAGKNAPRDRIVILEDTKGTGVCDKRTVFAEGKDFPVLEERRKAGLGAFDLCTGIEVGHGGVFVGAAPYLWFIENKDDRPGKFEVLLKGFGSQDTHETLNTLQWGPDGWLYGLHGVFTDSSIRATPNAQDRAGQLDGPATRMNAAVWRYHPKRKQFEIFAEGTSNPWGLDWRNSDGQFILACCVIPHLFHIVPGGIYKRQAGTSFNPYVYSYINEICDHTFHRESGWAHAGLLSLDVPHMPEKYRNSVIFGSIHGCSLKQNILKPHGSTFIASRGDDFLQSGDKNFRPINLRWGPLGDIYLIDWHDQNPCHQAAADSWDYEHGRVYRIQLKGTKPRKAEDLGKLNPLQLQMLTAQADPYSARTAIRLLAERAEPPRASQKEQLANGFWAYLGAEAQGLAVSEANLRAKNTPSESVAVRAFSVRMVSQRADFDTTMMPVLQALAAAEPEPTVRRELASAAIRLVGQRECLGLVHALLQHQEDAGDPVIPQLVWIAYEKLFSKKETTTPERELNWLAERVAENALIREQIVPRVMRRLAATGQAADLNLCIAFIARLMDHPSREKALEGLVFALTGQTVLQPEGWASLYDNIVKANHPRQVALANKLAVSFGDPAAIKRAIAAASNAALAVGERVEAVRQMGAMKAPETIPLLLELVNQDTHREVRSEAIRALAAFEASRIPKDLLASWKSYPQELRADLVNTLATRKEWARALLEAMAAGTVDRRDVTDNVILRIQAFSDASTNALIEKAWGRTRPTPADLNALINRTRASLDATPASFNRGKIVFANHCAKCHKFEGVGADVGPPLEGAARDIEYILVNVLDPNRVVGAPYFVRTARLLNETVFQGVLAEENEQTITLKLENNVLKTIKKADLDGPVKVSEKSLMPEGLSSTMTPQDFRDLVRYFMANPFVTEATASGEKLSAGVTGRLLLPNTKGAPAVVEVELTAASEVKTRLLVGSSADYQIRLDGKPIGTGKGVGKTVQPDQSSFDVLLTAGRHTLTIVSSDGTDRILYARFLDPERKLRYPDVMSRQP